MGIRGSNGVITSAERDKDTGILQVHASFLMEGELVYDRGGKKITEINPWDYISDENSLKTSTGKPITNGHPPIRNNWVTRKDLAKYQKGVTGNMIYLHRPFAVISCIVTDQELADDIESGHVERVSSCRRTTPLIDTVTKQRYQGPWEANHLAFIDKRSGRTGRSPGAMLLPQGEVPSMHEDGSICLDSVPGLAYDIPDYSKFVQKSSQNGLMLFLPPEVEVDDISQAARSRRIILDNVQLVNDDEEDESVALTAEELAAIGTSVAAGLKDTFAGFQDAIVAAVTPVVPVADEQDVFTQADLDAAVAAAAKVGAQRGKLLALAAEHKADEGLTDASAIKDICVAVLKKLDPEINADSYDEAELPGLVQGLCRIVVKKATDKPKYEGKKVVADAADPAPTAKPSAALEAQRAAIKKQYAKS